MITGTRIFPKPNHTHHSKRFVINCPRSTENVELSIPHRLLALLLNRRLLKDYLPTKDDVRKLLTSKESIIRIKSSAERLPVFLKSKSRGLGLTESPMPAEALSQYLLSRTRQIGLIAGKILTTILCMLGAGQHQIRWKKKRVWMQLESCYIMGPIPRATESITIVAFPVWICMPSQLGRMKWTLWNQLP